MSDPNYDELHIRGKVERVLYITVDPTVTMDGKPLPALTTVLHRVCAGDEVKFEEATRLIELFVREALKP